MPTRTRLNATLGTALDLPPGFNLVTLREVGDAFAHGQGPCGPSLAPARWSMSGVSISPSFAVVLEPNEPLRTARRAFYAGMAALGDALAARAPPEKRVVCVWPATFTVDQVWSAAGNSPGRWTGGRAAGLDGVRRA